MGRVRVGPGRVGRDLGGKDGGGAWGAGGVRVKLGVLLPQRWGVRVGKIKLGEVEEVRVEHD